MLTLNSGLSTYTVIGSKERMASSGLAAVLLNSGSGIYSKRNSIETLKKQGFDYIVSVENSGEHYEAQQLCELFPFVCFVLLKEPTSIGQMINIAAGELKSPLFFVIWNDFHLLQGLTNTRIVEKMLTPNDKDWYMRLCMVPVIQDSAFATLPTAGRPVILRKKMNIQPFSPNTECAPTIFAYKGIGIYSRELFFNIGGFDPSIKAEYWQLMDFGVRAWLWGQRLQTTQLVRLRYDGDFSATDTTVDEAYWAFFLKNLAPVLRRNSKQGDTYPCHIPWAYFMQYWLKSQQSLTQAYKKFREARLWVRQNSTHYVYDASQMESFFRTVL
ncbi:MAG: hypothetical protein Ta2G_19350 [Termitinemataceae bacterium]|nr:MAG: hypothetical protein Ta2G_19350 [Termitinemataceae bacterium]